MGECIERLFPERLDEFYGLLAHHYGQAEDWPKAHEYLLKAADQAGRIAADAEALGFYRRALETHAQVFGDRWEPVERAALERGMAEALLRLGRHEEAREHLYRALDLLGASYPQSQRGVGRAFVRGSRARCSGGRSPVAAGTARPVRRTGSAVVCTGRSAGSTTKAIPGASASTPSSC